jgi:peptidoglycan/xylan/chitin deacetylase (PgdA/CDA1 family)
MVRPGSEGRQTRDGGPIEPIGPDGWPIRGTRGRATPPHDGRVTSWPRGIGLGAVGAVALGLAAALTGVGQVAATPAATVVRHVTTTRGVVALTFDDAWDPSPTRRVVETLRAADVPATFFPVADGVERDPGLWRTIAAAGYPVGNHTVDHRDLTRLSDAAVRDELERARTTIERATGRPMAPLLRPPNGALDERIRRLADALGFGTIVLWDVASSDWAEPSADLVAERSLAGTAGSIVLLHAGPESTVDALPSIIAGYRARGFTFVTVPQLLAAGG